MKQTTTKEKISHAVLEAMSVFMKKKTVIMVSHRMTGAEKFNRVVRMD